MRTERIATRSGPESVASNPGWRRERAIATFGLLGWQIRVINWVVARGDTRRVGTLHDASTPQAWPGEAPERTHPLGPDLSYNEH